MKIFKSKKDRKIETMALIINELDLKTLKKDLEIQELKDEIQSANDLYGKAIEELTQKNKTLEAKRRKSAGAIGGLTKQINKLIAENTELAYQLTNLKKEFEDFKKNKFVVKEIEAEKEEADWRSYGFI